MSNDAALLGRLKYTALATVVWATVIYIVAAGGGVISDVAGEAMREHLAPVTFVLTAGVTAILVGLSFLLQDCCGAAMFDRWGRRFTTLAISLGIVLSSFLLGFGIVALIARMAAVGSMALFFGVLALWIGLVLEQRLRRHRQFEPNRRGERLLAGLLLIVGGTIYASLPFAERHRDGTVDGDAPEQTAE